MKKILLILVVFLVTGCGNKLVCTYKEDYDDIKIKNKIEFNFKDNTYKQKDTMIFDSTDSAEEYFNDIQEYVEEYNLRLDGKTIISELEDTIKLDATKDEIKKQYESYDYNCK